LGRWERALVAELRALVMSVSLFFFVNSMYGTVLCQSILLILLWHLSFPILHVAFDVISWWSILGL
jgi:hypothetical protein